MELGVTPRRHNPVDSICRKLQTIQRRDREPNSPFQIPKLQSSIYDSPHTGLRCNLDTILKKRKGDTEHSSSPLVLTPGMSHSSGRTLCVPVTPLSPVNATYTITSTLGTLTEKASGASGHSLAWQLSCSTPAIHNNDARFGFTPSDQERSRAPAHSLLSYNLNFCSSDASTILDCELPYPALVVKRLSMGDGASLPSESKRESLAEVSLICEEDLLDTIFQACDTQCRGKVYVSHIVDYLRHTTSRSSEDSGLEELCNMLDPEHKDISIDLDTYHAIMKEWIEDCRNHVKDSKSDVTQESVKLPDNLSAKRSLLLNMTSGSLEASGGEASRAELETSDLVFCVADLQFNNQKLQEDVRKLKQAMEAMEESNQKLIDENEELRTQAKMGQQLLQKERMLKEEVEEMKLTLSSSEENRVRASARSKQMERENQTLISKISVLQDENMKVSVEVEDLQKKMKVLYELSADLQAQIHSFDAAMTEKDTLIQEKTRQIEELKAAVMEYSSMTELLREEKSKLESQMQLLQPDNAIPGLSLSVAYRLNQMSSGSLETELALAQQNPPEGAEQLSSICLASPLDETLDREVLLLLQGPTPEHMSMEFKMLINRLRREFEEDTLEVLTALPSFMKSQEVQDTNTAPRLQGLRVQLEQRRSEWTQGLEQLKQYTDSLEEELLKMASNMRRSRTEILHLSVRLQEQENHKLLLRDELDQLKTPQDRRDASSQTDLPQDDEENSSPEWDRVYPLLDSPEKETVELQIHTQEDDQKPNPAAAATGPCEIDENRLKDHDEPQQEEARFPACTGPHDTHEQAVCCSASLSHSSHPQCADEGTPSRSDPSLPHTPDVVSPPAHSPAVGEPFSLTERTPEEEPGPEGEQDVSDSMNSSQKLPQEQVSAVPTVLERSGLLPVAEEEEPTSEASQQGAKAGGGATRQSVAKDNGASVPLTIRSRIKKDLETPSGSMEAMGEQRSQDDSDTLTADKNGGVSENGESVKEDGLTQSEKDIEAEFLRLSLSHRCDMFTLEKRLHLEERSRNLAEENVRREVSSCQGLLQALIPLCGDDNPSLEIIQRLQKNLEILLQSVTRVASRSETLGSIHQESRMGKAVEVMIQHVENLRRTYTKEHAELLELRQNHLQKDRSFVSHMDQDDFRKKRSSADFYKVAARRVSIATIPRSSRAPAPNGMAKDATEMETLGRRSPGNMLGKNTLRAPLKRFISCTETEGPALRNSNPSTASSSTNPSPTTELASPFAVKAPPSELPEAPKGVCTWAALMVVLAAFVAVLGKMLIQPAADAAPVGTGDSWMAIQQILWPYTGLRHNGQPPV
ncbi:inositol 1,4,5-triphosphate receptor associated 2 [Neoarius graeffei]|uniref:inositol 1,4,5-triphosphate receptor associated 2 n=1 Tax=Neoarius graeffei TaxID=443677 RepID=UPI00298CC94A|nr:inositol 1,4,5-triphosphate receptor associated 2 [Neoarius graeffei]